MTTQKARENRLRRVADRRGLRLHKSRSRDPHAIDYECFMLSDLESRGAIFGMSAIGRYDATLEEIEDYFNREQDA